MKNARYIVNTNLALMKDTTLISVVTPIYNGTRFIMSAYECLNHQTYSNWEWVVVNDGSTDGTEALLRRLAAGDKRIRYYTQRNSGSAKYPRDRAVYISKGNLILPLDIDDTISNNYLELMLARMEETNADIVYPEMRFISLKSRETTYVLPVADFDTTQVYRGRDLVKETIPEWRIGCNGGLYRKRVWINMSYPEKSNPIWVYSDEIDERYYLLEAERVAFSKAHYFYCNHDESITNRVSPKRFQLLRCDMELISLIEREFGKDSEECRRANQKLFYSWRNMAAIYMNNYDKLVDGDVTFQQDLAQAFKRIDVTHLSKSERVRFLNLSNSKLLLSLFSMKYAPQWLAEKVMQRLMPNTYRWKLIRKRTEEQTHQMIDGSYTDEGERRSYKPCAVSLFCGNAPSGGLVDRLRGALSLYAACKQTHRDFRLFFTHPFLLTDYLVPNKYDWRIAAEELSFVRGSAEPIVIDTQTDTPRERKWQEEQFVRILEENPHTQLHFYSNASFSYDYDFSALFKELFKPGKRLQAHLDKIKEETGDAYITISARFCGLLDDFNEETYSEPLSANERKELLEAALEAVAGIARKHPTQLVIACSDSTTFLQQATERCHLMSIPGTISHIGNDTHHTYEYYEKTFLDFFVISGAQEVYLLRSSMMHNSGFPYAAARVGEKPYHIVEF